MHILVLGAAGMVGRKLTERLLRDGRLGKNDITRMTLQDVVAPAQPAKAGCPVDTVTCVPDQCHDTVDIHPATIGCLDESFDGPVLCIGGDDVPSAAERLDKHPPGLASRVGGRRGERCAGVVQLGDGEHRPVGILQRPGRSLDLAVGADHLNQELRGQRLLCVLPQGRVRLRHDAAGDRPRDVRQGHH